VLQNTLLRISGVPFKTFDPVERDHRCILW
jgi:hypothetical protein